MSDPPIIASKHNEGHHDVITPNLQTDLETDVQVQKISTSPTDKQILSFTQGSEQEYCMTEHELPSSLNVHQNQTHENFFDNCDIYIQFDTAFLSSSEALFKPIARSLRLARHRRNEGLLLLAWLVHVSIIWTLQALES